MTMKRHKPISTTDRVKRALLADRNLGRSFSLTPLLSRAAERVRFEHLEHLLQLQPRKLQVDRLLAIQKSADIQCLRFAFETLGARRGEFNRKLSEAYSEADLELFRDAAQELRWLYLGTVLIWVEDQPESTSYDATEEYAAATLKGIDWADTKALDKHPRGALCFDPPRIWGIESWEEFCDLRSRMARLDPPGSLVAYLPGDDDPELGGSAKALHAIESAQAADAGGTEKPIWWPVPPRYTP